MEKTAEIEQNVEIVKELEILSGCSLSNTNQFHGHKNGGSERVIGGAYGGENPLHRLGLFIKDEYLEDEDEEETFLNEDGGEEGEIL